MKAAAVRVERAASAVESAAERVAVVAQQLEQVLAVQVARADRQAAQQVVYEVGKRPEVLPCGRLHTNGIWA